MKTITIRLAEPHRCVRCKTKKNVSPVRVRMIDNDVYLCTDCSDTVRKEKTIHYKATHCREW